MEGVYKGYALALGSFLQLPPERCNLCLIPHYQGALIQDLISLCVELNLQANQLILLNLNSLMTVVYQDEPLRQVITPRTCCLE